MSCFDPGSDVCLNLFCRVYPQYFDFPPNARVLEIGCAEADWLTPMHVARPDLELVGIDWRGAKRTHAEVIKGDVLQAEFRPDWFDVIVSVSALEHIGLGHYDADPLDADGDIKAAKLAWQWLKPGGLFYFDVPWNPDPGYEVYGTKCRIYDDASLTSRLSPLPDKWKERFRGYAPSDAHRLIERPTTKADRFWYCANVWEKV